MDLISGSKIRITNPILNQLNADKFEFHRHDTGDYGETYRIGLFIQNQWKALLDLQSKF
jgi:hypothetical protein